MNVKTKMNDYILKRARELEQDTIETRTYLHLYPEVSSLEYETSRYLKKRVTDLGLIVEEVPGSTGFTALLDTSKPGKTLGIRTDIDALPIDENPYNLMRERTCISKNPGAMHACGHDGHMAIILTTIQIMKEMLEDLSGKVYFIFEEGEEIGAGIDAMIEHLKDKKIDAIYGNHLTSFMKTGTICADEGPVMAGAVLVDFDILGESGHGSRPDLSVNPIFATVQVLSALTSAWVNRLDVTKTVTLGLTQIHGGSANNVIPNKVSVGGSMRFFDIEEGKKAVELTRKVATLTAEAHECTVKFSPKFGIAGNPVVNDKHLASIAQKGIDELMPNALVHEETWFASESFNKYRNIAPTLFVFVGIKNEEYGSGAEHHNDKFDVDENALVTAVLAMTKFGTDFLTVDK